MAQGRGGTPPPHPPLLLSSLCYVPPCPLFGPPPPKCSVSGRPCRPVCRAVAQGRIHPFALRLAVPRRQGLSRRTARANLKPAAAKRPAAAPRTRLRRSLRLAGRGQQALHPGVVVLPAAPERQRLPCIDALLNRAALPRPAQIFKAEAGVVSYPRRRVVLPGSSLLQACLRACCGFVHVAVAVHSCLTFV